MVESTSPHGRWDGAAMVVDIVRPGELCIPFHLGWGGERRPPTSTPGTRDPVSQQPPFKSAPVALRRDGIGTPECWLLDRYAELAGDSVEPYAVRRIGGTVMRVVPQ